MFRTTQPQPAFYRDRLLEENASGNIHVVNVVALAVSILAASFLVGTWVYDMNNFLPNVIAHKRAASFLLVNSLVAYTVSLLANQQKIIINLYYKRLFNTYYALVIILGCMFLSFVVQQQGISLTMFTVGLMCVASLWALEIQELLIVIIISALFFYIGIRFSQPVAQLRQLEMLLAVLLFISFYGISRWIYSYKVNLFVQLLQIQQKNNEYEKANADKMNMLSMVAHDLRNPINSIETVVGVLKPTLTTEEQLEYADMINQSSKKARNIINDIVEAAKEDQETELALEETNINETVANAFEVWKHTAVAKHTLEYQTTSKMMFAMLNKAKFIRVLDNLIGNAIKFSEEETTITLRLLYKNGLALLEVEDKGIGIPEHLLPHVFDRFTKSSRMGLRGEKSIGLGLHICQQLMHLMNSEIEVHSVANQGSTFTLKIPLVSAE
ncbi:MAG: sensor histidine kinase [Bacteroidetes bacterium]|nr:MAG: sensor histidine kinase [Bacteroidota bacterium]